MKKLFVVLTILAVVATMSACKGKRCVCVESRYGYPNATSLVPKDGHANCSELDFEQFATDSVSLITRVCTDEK